MKDEVWARAIDDHLKATGHETWRNRKARVKRGPVWINLGEDLWGCIDIAAMNDGGFLFVQACMTSGIAEHRRKIETHHWPKTIGYKVEIWEARKQRSMADRRKWEYAARIHVYRGIVEKEWYVLPEVVRIVKR